MTTKDQIHELDDKILAVTRKRFDMQFGGTFTEKRLKQWMEFAKEVEELETTKNKIIRERDSAKVYA
jgi:hypothetical protein